MVLGDTVPLALMETGFNSTFNKELYVHFYIDSLLKVPKALDKPSHVTLTLGWSELDQLKLYHVKDSF